MWQNESRIHSIQGSRPTICRRQTGTQKYASWHNWNWTKKICFWLSHQKFTKLYFAYTLLTIRVEFQLFFNLNLILTNLQDFAACISKWPTYIAYLRNVHQSNTYGILSRLSRFLKTRLFPNTIGRTGILLIFWLLASLIKP